MLNPVIGAEASASGGSGGTTSLPITSLVVPNLSGGTTFTGTTVKMLGMAASSSHPSIFKPTITGKVLIEVVLIVRNSASTKVTVGLRWAIVTNHAAPTHGATVVGTTVTQGTVASYFSATHTGPLPLLSAVVQGTVGKTLWVDVAGKPAATGQTVTFEAGITVLFQETH